MSISASEARRCFLLSPCRNEADDMRRPEPRGGEMSGDMMEFHRTASGKAIGGFASWLGSVEAWIEGLLPHQGKAWANDEVEAAHAAQWKAPQ